MSDIEYGDYRITWLNGKACATITKGKGDARKRRRIELKGRDGLPLKKSTATVAELRAALVAFAGKQAKEDFRAAGEQIGPMLDAYMAHRIADGKQAHPIDTQIKALKPFWGDMHPHDVTEDLCKGYAAYRGLDADGKQIMSSSTILSELTRLSTALRWAAERDMVTGWGGKDDVPVMWFPQPADAKDRFLSADEALRLIGAALTTHTKLFILLALYTGARKQAILELTWDRVDFDKASVNYKVATVRDLLKKTAKKGRGTPPVPPEVLAELRLAKEQAKSNHVIEFEGKPVKDNKTTFNATRDRAGLGADVTRHTLRHTFATWCEAMGVPAQAVARALGHKKESTTKDNYQHAATEGARPATDAIAAKLKLHAIKGGKN